MEIPLLKELVIILGLSVGVIYIFQRLRLPTILGFLATGILFGPGGLGLIEASHDIEILSEIGIILLLFIIGLEFSLAELARIKKVVLVGGAFQVGLTTAAVYGLAVLWGLPPAEALFFGFLLSMSSTAIVLKILQSDGLMGSPHGKIALGILIFQDIIVVPMMLLTPMLEGGEGNLAAELGFMALKVAAVVVITLVSARYLIPRLLQAIVGTRSRELFIITIVVICFAVAWGTSQLGLSLSLGAFLAGLIISESEYSHQATGLIIPFREIFASFFFVSIGMLLDVEFFASHLPGILAFTAVVFLLKFLILFGSSAILRYPLRTNLLNGLTLFQVGEFAFILAAVGMQYDLIEGETYQYFLSMSILTMAITPFVIQKSETIVKRVLKGQRGSKNASLRREEKKDALTGKLEDHLLIVGFGLNGQNMASIAKNAQIPYGIVDVNNENVERGRKEGHPIMFGDAGNPYVLDHLHVHKARVAVVAISDPPATKKVVTTIRTMANTVHIIVRTRFLNETEEYLQLGASEVISEEFETSMEIFSRVLHQYLVPDSEIHNYVHAVRKSNYRMLRPFFTQNTALGLPSWQDLKVVSLEIKTSSKDLVKRSLADLELRRRYGVSVMAIYRSGETNTAIDPSAHLEKGDLVYIFGSPEAIQEFGKVAAG